MKASSLRLNSMSSRHVSPDGREATVPEIPFHFEFVTVPIAAVQDHGIVGRPQAPVPDEQL